MRRQTYGYLPSHKASLPIGWYQILLLGDRGTCVNNLPRVAFDIWEAMIRTRDLLIECHSHSATEPHINAVNGINRKLNKCKGLDDRFHHPANTSSISAVNHESLVPQERAPGQNVPVYHRSPTFHVVTYKPLERWRASFITGSQKWHSLSH